MAKIATPDRTYFLTYLLPPTLTETEFQAYKKTFEALLTKHKGVIVNLEDWGKRRLAYKIKHHGKWFTEAFYVHTTISMNPGQVVAFEKDIYLQVQIMRHLLVVADLKESPKSE